MQTRPGTSPSSLEAGSEIQERVEHLGSELAEALSAVLAEVPNRGAGPQMLANVLEITVATASRLLKALSQERPVAILQLIPGPNPLRRIVESARAHGVSASTSGTALARIEEFDLLIREIAGYRSSFKAVLSTWLPGERREFEAARRQSVFKAMCELNGVSCDLDLSSILLHPSQEPGKLDLVDVKALLGIDRIRPDAVVHLSTQAVDVGGVRTRGERTPSNLAGEPASDGLHSVRLDAYCSARPAPLSIQTRGGHVLYSLGPTGFGPSSTVDLVLAEVNRAELDVFEPGHEAMRPYFFHLPELAARKSVFDLVVHRDVYPDFPLELLAFDTTGRGPASVNDPLRSVDRRRVHDELTVLGPGLARLRLLEFPRYTELLREVMEKLGWDPLEFRTYRLKLAYPLLGAQMTMAFEQPPG